MSSSSGDWRRQNPKASGALQPAGKTPAAKGPRQGTAATKQAGPPTGGSSPEAESPESQLEETWIDRLLLGAPPWLVSAIVHTFVLVMLAILFLPPMRRRGVELESIWAEKFGEQLETETFQLATGNELQQDPILTPENLPLVENPFAAPPDVPITSPIGEYTTSDVVAPQIGLALSGREEGMKKALLAAYGGTATTEEAVRRGLQWLARQQLKDGSWSLCGPYSDGVREDWENKVAATAMALIAFQGAGNTTKQGPFRANVERGWKWLLDQQDADGNFFQEGPFNHRFYTNGLCGIALCELFGMTRDERYREPAERLIDYLLRSQSPEGGWRYSPQADSDLSVTGWIVMALQSARMAGLHVPPDVFRKVERFLDSVSHAGGSRYSYQRRDEPTLAMTAEGLLCRQYLGWRRNDSRLLEGVKFLTQPENLINYDTPDVYYWYYATQVCHHMEGEAWRTWNERMRQAVPAHQVKSGPEAGSWDPLKPKPDKWAENGGRLYVTCLSIYMLEVYYRHLPLYTNVFTLLGLPAPQEAQAAAQTSQGK
ncbi:MAG: terpene cyclase/mutase family protein [Thermoguttaceae bacterium]|nr:terpene cyclase/mutase family protein [Thermoguttaceae bacterium]MDW8080174.1 terpene cyclase/mutase family protein [Thermoguttaceae bacterium]